MFLPFKSFELQWQDKTRIQKQLFLRIYTNVINLKIEKYY